MAKDLTPLLINWPAEPGSIRARKFTASDGKVFIQMRIDLGVLQMALDGRPDGQRPLGAESMLDFVRARTEHSGRCSLTESRQKELTREMLQYYRRRISLMALAKQAQKEDDLDEADACYRRAIRDADHNLAILDLLVSQGADLDLVDEHEQYRPFIIMHQASCRAERALLVQDPDEAIEQLKSGIIAIQGCDDDCGHARGERGHDLRPFVDELRRFERQIRRRYRRRRTLREQLYDAIASENFEQAAKIRDVLAARGSAREA